MCSSYLLAAAAVLIAVIGAYVEHPILKLVLVALELFVIVAIIQLVRYGGKNAWHERWIDYRLVAESLRHARFLAYVSEFGLIHRKDLANQPWTIWYIRATLREIGLPGATLDRAYQRPLLQSVLAPRSPRAAPLARDQYRRDGEGRPLPASLRPSAASTTRSARCASASWGWSPSSCCCRSSRSMPFSSWRSPGCCCSRPDLPALGAALAGIRVQGEFEDYKERSEHMIAELNALEATYRVADSSSSRSSTAPPTS